MSRQIYSGGLNGNFTKILPANFFPAQKKEKDISTENFFPLSNSRLLTLLTHLTLLLISPIPTLSLHTLPPLDLKPDPSFFNHILKLRASPPLSIPKASSFTESASR